MSTSSGRPSAEPYQLATGRVRLSGIQALARLPIEQSKRDRATGLRIGTFISGYEGSPLAGYDLELMRHTSLLAQHDIVFQAGLNEEAAAMAVQGSQLATTLPSQFDGVVGIWYGKAPGLDRATDAFRHANLMGTHPRGGAVAIVGDDPAAKSSSVPSRSEQALADLGVPTFYPADAGDILEMGHHAVELSRASGLWTALKVVTAIADGSTVLDLVAEPATVLRPEGSALHEPTARLLQPALGPLERDLVDTRLRIVADYASLNGLNRVVASHTHDRVGILAAGKTYLDVRQALTMIGLDESDLEVAGIRLMKVGLVWPLEPRSVKEFAAGLDELIVVEEKRPHLESAAREILYGTTAAPTITGKVDDSGASLFPAYGELDADSVALGLARRLADRLDCEEAKRWLAQQERRHSRDRLHLPVVSRTPTFCSGCPHNVSTSSHTDSPVGAGIGCHTMVLLMEPDRVGDVVGLTQMGGEGTQWIGMAPFADTSHFVQNIGDGTFHHSGSLAIRASVAAKVNITYRLLHNSTVAMTGGQAAVGQMNLRELVANLRSEGVARIIVTTDNVRRARRRGLKHHVEVWDRSRLAEAEAVLAATPGTTALIHDQECATELRRKRKRGIVAGPREHVFINERLCEGCGDCGAKSNCMSVEPIETEFGRKTRIHQGSCNNDLLCLEGDCPAFMTIEARGDGSASVAAAIEQDELPEPAAARDQADQSIRLMGIGGTGIVTTTQILATAGVLSGLYVRTLDQTGLAQKGGAVVSDIKLSTRPIEMSNQIARQACDLYVGCDILVATEGRNLTSLSPSATAVVSTSTVPTAAMVRNKDIAFPPIADLLTSISDRLDKGSVVSVDARRVVETFFGGDQFVNMFLLGVAYQLGSLCVSHRAIEEAISLNGVAIGPNTQAFRRGRQYIACPDDLAHALGASSQADAAEADDVGGGPLDRIVSRRARELRAYQDRRYARRYTRLVADVHDAELRAGFDGTELSEAVARHFFKLLAYKDEYEVARLAMDATVQARVRTQFGSGARVRWRLHPPALRALGFERKVAVGRWFVPVFAVLRVMRMLRGTVLDPFGWTRVRAAERRLARQYEDVIDRLLPHLSSANYPLLLEIANLPDIVRGYEDVKLAAIARYDARLAVLLDGLPNDGAAGHLPAAAQ